MNQELFLKAATRREMLRAPHCLPVEARWPDCCRGLCWPKRRPRSRESPKPVSCAADPVEQMKKQMGSVPLQTLKLRDNIQMLSGPGGNMVVLDGPDGKILVDSSFASVAPKSNRSSMGSATRRSKC